MTNRTRLPDEPTATAPDGSEVRVLLATPHGGMAHFRFPPGGVSPGVRHRTVSELWYVVSGEGSMWLSDGPRDGYPVSPGTCVRIPVGTAFQVRCDAGAPLEVIGATMPPWPGTGETEFVDDAPWPATLEPGPH